MNKAVFLDRDGTINIDKGYVYKIENFFFIQGTIEALQLIQSYQYKIIVITNQSGIARGYYTENDLNKLNTYMFNELKKHNISINGFYYCPHLPDSNIEKYKVKCKCRKPGTQLFEQAALDHDIDFKYSYAVGDKLRDLNICNITKCIGYLVGNNEDKKIIDKVKNKKFDRIKYAKDLLSFAKEICK